MDKQEIWKPILGYEGHYEVSDFGRVRSLKRRVKSKRGVFRTIHNRILKLCDNSKGYLALNFSKNGYVKSYTVHSLVAQAFLGYKLNGTRDIVCDHVDNNRLNNNLKNLQIITNRENASKDRVGISKHTGVSWHKRRKKWCSQIRINGKVQHLGYFNIEIEASNEYQRALKEFKTTGKITRPRLKRNVGILEENRLNL